MPPSTLVMRKGKWYVAVTVPKSLEPLSPQKQLRRSTGTSDTYIAKQKQHGIAQTIYHELRLRWVLAKSDQSSNLLTEWEHDAAQLANALGVYKEAFEPSRYRKFLDQAAQDVLNDAYFNGKPVSAEALDSAVSYVSWETIDDREWNILNGIEESEQVKIQIINGKTHVARTILNALPSYLGGRNWNREATKKGAEGHIRHFAKAVGNLCLDQIEKAHAYDFARALAEEGKANRTIKTSVSSVTSFLTWCEHERLIPTTPFFNLKLSNYGTPSEKYKPLSTDELMALFKLKMPDEDRLILSILISTGMRLDEAALLTWQRIKTVNEIRCFDLTDYEEAIKIKNKQSLRLVPIPDCIKLPVAKSEGPLFSYRRDEDGKAEGAASKALMRHIRKITTDRRKVVHSLRGTLKDLMRDANIPKELSDFITGHGSKDEGGKYGSGHSLELKKDAVNKISHPWLTSNI